MATKPEIDPRIFLTAPVIKKAADHKAVYANMVRTGLTPFDIRMVFSQVGEPIPGGHPQQIEDLATVIMAPEEAKALLPLIQKAIEVYESQYGEIRNVTPLIEKMREEALAKAATPADGKTANKTETPRKPKKH